MQDLNVFEGNSDSEHLLFCHEVFQGFLPDNIPVRFFGDGNDIASLRVNDSGPVFDRLTGLIYFSKGNQRSGNIGGMDVHGKDLRVDLYFFCHLAADLQLVAQIKLNSIVSSCSKKGGEVLDLTGFPVGNVNKDAGFVDSFRMKGCYILGIARYRP
jgi:hypothetical protein